VAPDFVPRVVIESGKPALVVPCTEVTVQREGFGTVLVAWKESREAARALSAAMPLLLRADAVHVALDGGVAEAQRALLLRFLQSHGVEAQVHAVSGPSAQAGAGLLSRAATLNADLMVMGCYGHSRGRELVLGGATRTVLHEMTIPGAAGALSRARPVRQPAVGAWPARRLSNGVQSARSGSPAALANAPQANAAPRSAACSGCAVCICLCSTASSASDGSLARSRRSRTRWRSSSASTSKSRITKRAASRSASWRAASRCARRRNVASRITWKPACNATLAQRRSLP
jgi:nucleotide-binding universal stress UspA family protein